MKLNEIPVGVLQSETVLVWCRDGVRDITEYKSKRATNEL